jgi:hypothetical protein
MHRAAAQQTEAFQNTNLAIGMGHEMPSQISLPRFPLRFSIAVLCIDLHVAHLWEFTWLPSVHMAGCCFADSLHRALKAHCRT